MEIIGSNQSLFWNLLLWKVYMGTESLPPCNFNLYFSSAQSILFFSISYVLTT